MKQKWNVLIKIIYINIAQGIYRTMIRETIHSYSNPRRRWERKRDRRVLNCFPSALALLLFSHQALDLYRATFSLRTNKHKNTFNKLSVMLKKEKNNVPFLNLRCKMDIQIHRAQRTTKELNLKKTVLRCIIAYLTKVKDKERPLKAERKATLPWHQSWQWFSNMTSKAHIKKQK